MDAGSKNPKEYFLLCQQYREQNKIAEAIAVIESLKLIPLDKRLTVTSIIYWANLYYECQQYDRVEEELQTAVNLDPNFTKRAISSVIFMRKTTGILIWPYNS